MNMVRAKYSLFEALDNAGHRIINSIPVSSTARPAAPTLLRMKLIRCTC